MADRRPTARQDKLVAAASRGDRTATRPTDLASCPSCHRGRLAGTERRRYCQRCSWFEAGDRERVEAAAPWKAGLP